MQLTDRNGMTWQGSASAIIPAVIRTFSTFDEAGNVTSPPDLETVRAWALATVRQLAAAEEDKIDALVVGNPVRMMMLNTEIIQYQNDGRPANPSAAVFALADALATRRGATLRNTLESLRTRWLAVRSRIATVVTELDRVEDALQAAVDVAEIETILAGVSW